MIISISGQHEHQLLLKPDNHLYLLDDFGGLTDERLELEEAFAGYESHKDSIDQLEKEIREGNKLSDSIAKANFLPDIFTGLIEVGEQTGNLSEVFSEMEQRLRATYENSVTSFVTLIEPVMIIIMGLIVGSVVVTMLLSMVSISDINF